MGSPLYEAFTTLTVAMFSFLDTAEIAPLAFCTLTASLIVAYMLIVLPGIDTWLPVRMSPSMTSFLVKWIYSLSSEQAVKANDAKRTNVSLIIDLRFFMPF